MRGQACNGTNSSDTPRLATSPREWRFERRSAAKCLRLRRRSDRIRASEDRLDPNERPVLGTNDQRQRKLSPVAPQERRCVCGDPRPYGEAAACNQRAHSKTGRAEVCRPPDRRLSCPRKFAGRRQYKAHRLQLRSDGRAPHRYGSSVSAARSDGVTGVGWFTSTVGAPCQQRLARRGSKRTARAGPKSDSGPRPESYVRRNPRARRGGPMPLTCSLVGQLQNPERRRTNVAADSKRRNPPPRIWTTVRSRKVHCRQTDTVT